jgi:TatD DNase family protein
MNRVRKYAVPFVPEYIDSHAHTNFNAFDEDREAMFQRAREAGVAAIVEVGVGLAGSRAAVERARETGMVFAAAGLHPTELDHFHDEWDEFEALVRSGSAVAVGECGLDYYWMKAKKELQAESFRRQLELARDVGLPFIVHCRDAEEDVIAILREVGYGRGVTHCFSGTMEQAEQVLELGLCISFCGNVTYRKNAQAQQVAKAVPPERLLLETDSPFLSPQGKRGKRNEPAHVALTARYLAELRGEPLEELARATTANARRLFPIE